MRFRAALDLHGKTATGFVVPEHVVDALAGGRQPSVSVKLNGHSWRTTIAVRGGRHLLGVSAEHRAAADVAAGDVLDVDVELDTAPRIVEPPEDLAAALAAQPGARERFDALAPSHRKEHVRAIEDAKKPETRARRIAKTVETLSR